MSQNEMGELSAECRHHLEEALQNDDPAEKDFHIRQVLQACGVDGLPDDVK